MTGVLAVLLVLVVVAMLVAVGAWTVGRARSGQGAGFSPRMLLIAYLYVMCAGGLLAGTFGLAGGLKVGMAQVFGREVSYYRPPLAVPVAPGETKPDKPTADDQRRAIAENDRQVRQDAIAAVTSLLVGAVLFVTHTVARRRVVSAQPGFETLMGRAYTAILLAIFGITGVVSLIMAIQSALQYLLLPFDEFSYREPPGQNLSMAIVFVPAWLYTLWVLVRQSRNEE